MPAGNLTSKELGRVQGPLERLLRQDSAPRFFLIPIFVLALCIDYRYFPKSGGPSISPLELVTIGAMALIFADMVIYPRNVFGYCLAAYRNNPWVVLYFSWALVAALLGFTVAPTSFWVFRNIYPAFVLFVVLSGSIKTGDEVRTAFGCFAGFAVVNIALGVSQALFKGPYPVPLNAAVAIKMDIDGTFVVQTVTGLFNHPNGLAVFLLPVVIGLFGLGFARGGQGRVLRTASLLLLPAAVYVLFESKAKGAGAWAVFGIAWVFAPRWGFVDRRRVALGLLSLAGGIATLILVSVYIGGTLRTMNTRLELWQAAIYVISKDPFVAFFGSGYQGMWAATARFSTLQYSNAHNGLLNEAIYFGIPGALFYIVAVLHALRRLADALHRLSLPESRLPARIAFGTLLALVGEYFFEPAVEASGLVAQWFFFVSVAGVIGNMAREDEGRA